VTAYLIARRRRHMQGLTGRLPARRRVPAVLLPKAITTSYTRLVLDLVGVIRAALHRELVPKLPQYAARARELLARTDAVDDDIGLLRTGLQRGVFDRAHLTLLVRPMASRVADFHQGQLERQLRAATGVEVPVRTPHLAESLDAFTAENVALLSSLADEVVAQVEKMTMRGLAQGEAAADIISAIDARLDGAEKRGALIARDQTHSLFSQLNEVRQKDVGITHFIWRTANDERTCDICAPLDGKRFAWDEPPSDGAPGEVHFRGCRCFAEPDVSALLDSLAA
jgi:SPP1 gp7 family putative phage head morphogenesis protein